MPLRVSPISQLIPKGSVSVTIDSECPVLTDEKSSVVASCEFSLMGKGCIVACYASGMHTGTSSIYTALYTCICNGAHRQCWLLREYTMRRVTTVGCVLERGTFDSLRHPVNTDTNKRDRQIDFAIIIRFSQRMHTTGVKRRLFIFRAVLFADVTRRLQENRCAVWRG